MAQENPVSLRNALNLLEKGDKAGAKALVVQILIADSDHEIAWVLLSYLVEQPEQKRDALNQALRINPGNQKVRDLISQLERIPRPMPARSQIPVIPSAQPHKPVEPQDPPDLRESIASQSVPSESDPKTRTGEPDSYPQAALLTKAADYLKARDDAAARTILHEILAQDPKNARAWYMASFVMKTQQGRIEALYRTLQLAPHDQKARVRLAKLKVESEQQQQARSLPVSQESKFDWQAFKRIGKYVLRRGLVLFLTVVVGVYITILIANMGGHVDELIRGIVANQLLAIGQSEAFDQIPVDERVAYMEQMEWQLEESMGLHEPFFLRSIRWLVHGLTLNLGEVHLTSWFGVVFSGPDATAQQFVKRHLPYTLLLIGTANVLFFFTSVSAALVLSRKYGSWMDRVSAAMASLSSAPSWIFGIFLILLLAGGLRVLPFPKAIDLNYADFSDIRYIRLLLTQMIMPVLAIFLSVFFQGVYAWRTFFLIYSQENYVEMGRAKGLPAHLLERRYILRPTLPYVLTNFALMMIAMWETSLALEILFYWPGIGSLFVKALSSYTQTPLVIAIVVAFAYILVITLFVLDIVYAIIDPRVGMGGENRMAFSVGARRKFIFRRWLHDLVTGVMDFFRGILDWLCSIPTWFRRLPKGAAGMRTLADSLQQIKKFPSAIVGLAIILGLIGVSIYTIYAIPYDKAVELWRAHGSENGRSVWAKNPRNAEPVWFNLFRREKLPETLILDSRDPDVDVVYEQKQNGMTGITISLPFEYDYDTFPDEITLFFESRYVAKMPHVSLFWLTPDGREIRLKSFSADPNFEYRLSLDDKLSRKLNGLSPAEGLFIDPQSQAPMPLKGTYELRVEAITFEEDSQIDVEYVLYGKVYGLAGTDHHRRDLTIALLWGTPVALAFGLIGAIGTSLLSMFIAALGVWRGGWVDATVQRITEVNLILPTLPIAIMIYFLYSRSIWVILGVIILLNIFGSAIKNYRAAFLQVKQSAYVEGAIAYGASGSRIILHYLVPRIMPVLLPQLVILVPGFIFYEATLAYLGLSDPYLPTWGKLVYDAVTNGAYAGYYYWILEPLMLLMVTGLAFALLGFSLDRVVNPRLRDI